MAGSTERAVSGDQRSGALLEPSPLVRERFITLEPIEEELTAALIDARLAAGWFPWCGQWMTCDAWPGDEGPRNTVWLRVRLERRPTLDRWRRLRREGCTVSVLPSPQCDEEHRQLYEHFRQTRHPDWSVDGAEFVGSQQASPFAQWMRELAVRDATGRLIAYRWFLQGATAIAGTAAIYNTETHGLGTIARTLADQWAADAGLAWSYPGYVMPGAADPWRYKVKAGRSEWLEPHTGRWRAWDAGEPLPDRLPLAVMAQHLAQFGEVHYNPGWAAPCVRNEPDGVAAPWFVFGPPRGDRTIIIVWNRALVRYERLSVLMLVPREADDSDGSEDPDDSEGSDDPEDDEEPDSA